MYRISGHFRLVTVFFTRSNWDFACRLVVQYLYVLERSTYPRHATCSATTDGRSHYFRATLRYLIPTCLELFALLLIHCYIDGTFHNVHAPYALGSLIMGTVNSSLARNRRAGQSWSRVRYTLAVLTLGRLSAILRLRHQIQHLSYLLC